MHSNSQNIESITFEEIIEASKSMITPAEKQLLKSRIEQCSSDDEAFIGAKLFLKEHNYDFNALQTFLNEPISFKFRNSIFKTYINYKFFSAIAACLIFIIVYSVIYISNNQANKTIANAVFYEPGLPVFASIQGNKEFNEMISSFRQNNTKEGLLHYHELLKTETNNDTINYFAGWLYFNDHQFDSALYSFNKVAKTSIYSIKSNYLKGLSNYLNGNKKEAKILLDSISKEEQNIYRIKAKELIENKWLW